jgi:hypothetical protein
MDNDGADDLRNEGAPITQDRIIYLKELVKETNSDEAAFLRFAGADSYEKIGSGKYDVLVRALLKKKQA